MQLDNILSILTLWLDFNCNSFTNDCIGLLTGGSIPNWIKGEVDTLNAMHLCLLILM